MHSFKNFCIDPASLVVKENLSSFVKALLVQSNTPAALIPYHDTVPEVDDENRVIGAPRYFGAGGEFLSETFFEIFAQEYNVTNLIAIDDEEKEAKDRGVDLTARTIKGKVYKDTGCAARANSPVYIQVKTVLNPNKEHYTNDGSRIMNFFGHAQACARNEGASYTARYILFTTGKGLHYRLKENTCGMIQVVNFKEISDKIKNNRVFWNRLREKLGQPILPLDNLEVDADFASVQEELEKGVDTA